MWLFPNSSEYWHQSHKAQNCPHEVTQNRYDNCFFLQSKSKPVHFLYCDPHEWCYLSKANGGFSYANEPSETSTEFGDIAQSVSSCFTSSYIQHSKYFKDPVSSWHVSVPLPQPPLSLGAHDHSLAAVLVHISFSSDSHYRIRKSCPSYPLCSSWILHYCIISASPNPLLLCAPVTRQRRIT